MYDRGLVIDILNNVNWSLGQVTKRFQTKEPKD